VSKLGIQVKVKCQYLYLVRGYVCCSGILLLDFRLKLIKRDGSLLQYILQPDQGKELLSRKRVANLSIIIPTYNEAENIIDLLSRITKLFSFSSSVTPEIIVVDDNSPDDTGRLVEYYSRHNTDIRDPHPSQLDPNCNYDSIGSKREACSVRVIHRSHKTGLVSAILEGIKDSLGQYILVMDADFSHSPELIPRMMHELENPDIDIVVASRYTMGGSIVGWPFKRRLISKGAVKIAKYGLPIKKDVKDPMSGFFALKRQVIQDITIDSAGYKILLEILVKANNARVKEIPYTFTDRKAGKSKLDRAVILDYIKAIYHLYRYGQKSIKTQAKATSSERRRSVLFLSKAGRFYTVGASGLLLNYLVSVLLAHTPNAQFGYLQSTIVGILLSNISNFVLNKFWTFEDKDFALKKTLKQYAFFAGMSLGGAAIQLGSLYVFLQSGFSYEVSLITAVALASISNFLLNKKWTFGEKIWG
jgi:dolichol-phosphate mannosyltransferase